MPLSKKLCNIRYFNYLNVPLLYSIYSQVFEGITDRITEEKIIQAITSNTEGERLSPARNETSAAEESRRIESLVLHDHMYTQLESKLADSIINASELQPDQVVESLKEGPIVKVSGMAEIEDYERIRTYFKKFNELVKGVAYASKNTEEHKIKVLDLIVKIAESKDTQRKSLQSELDKLTDSTSEARQKNMLQDPVLLDSLAKFPEHINPTGYEIVITPSQNRSVHYRGAIDRSWLRISPELINSMYGGQSAIPWTMVGIITHVQGTFTPLEQINITVDPDNPMMLDSFRNLFRIIRTFDRMFLESKKDTEIVLSPLAIYRELGI